MGRQLYNSQLFAKIDDDSSKIQSGIQRPLKPITDER